MFAWDSDGGFDVGWDIKWVGDLAGLRSAGELGGNGVVGIIDAVIVGGLVAGDVGFGGEIIVVILVDVEMIGLQLADDGDVWGFVEIPELETRHFVDDDGILGELVEAVDSGLADVAYEIGILVVGV